MIDFHGSGASAWISSLRWYFFALMPFCHGNGASSSQSSWRSRLSSLAFAAMVTFSWQLAVDVNFFAAVDVFVLYIHFAMLDPPSHCIQGVSAGPACSSPNLNTEMNDNVDCISGIGPHLQADARPYVNVCVYMSPFCPPLLFTDQHMHLMTQHADT